METNQAAVTDFQKTLTTVIEQRIFSKIQYRTELQEFVTVTSLIKERVTEDGRESVVLANGEKLPLDKIVSINGVIAPGYEDYMAISCDC
jgi:hypothetical protein